MRRVLAVAVCVIAIFGMVVPASAQAPAPRVTINGLVDFVTSAYKNWSGGSCVLGQGATFGGPSSNTCPQGDVTSNVDRAWYSRERGVFTITGEVGRTKGVWAFELDFTNGVAGVGSNAGNGFGQTGSPGLGFPGTTTGADLDTDVAGTLETKWVYLETPLFGAGSIMPFVPVDTLLRAGMQPATGHDYKVGILLSGDIPAITAVSTWAPNLRSTVTYVKMRAGLDEKLSNGNTLPFFAISTMGTPGGRVETRNNATSASSRGQDSWAIVASTEYDVFKGLTVKPTYAYADFVGGSGNIALGLPPVNGLSFNGLRLGTRRHTLGGDVRWTSGPFYVQPTYYYQWGNQQLCGGGGGGIGGSLSGAGANPAFPCPLVLDSPLITPALAAFVPGPLTNKQDVNIRTWIADVTAGFRTGPLNIEVRGIWTPGMSGTRLVGLGSDVGYYQSINSGFSYLAGWSDLQTGGIDYGTAVLAGAPGVAFRTAPSYDKYGRRFVAVAADYTLTPALTLHGLINASWTDTKVDTTSFLNVFGLNQTTPRDGTERYLGTELDAGLTYRFAPNVAFDLVGGYMSTGHAMDHARTIDESAAGIHHNAKDVLKASARVRFTF